MNIKYKYHIEQSTRYSFKMTRVQIVQQYSRIFKTTTKMCYHSSLIQLEILEMLDEKLSSTVTPESVIILSHSLVVVNTRV